jgi:hypothetical protein
MNAIFVSHLNIYTYSLRESARGKTRALTLGSSRTLAGNGARGEDEGVQDGHGIPLTTTTRIMESDDVDAWEKGVGALSCSSRPVQIRNILCGVPS